MVNNLSRDLINDDSVFLLDFIRSRIPIFVKYMQESLHKNQEPNKCSFQEFCKTVRKFVMPTKYQEDKILEFIFNQSKNKPEDTTINYKSFIDKLIDTKDENNFFNSKDVLLLFNNLKEVC